ncbi:hypothetical protein [Mycolicibacterium thermoresistibile]
MTTIAPPPPPTPPPTLSSGGRTTVRVVLVAAAALLLVATLAGLGVLAWGVSTVRVVADRQDLPAGMRTLTVDTGDIPAMLRITSDRETRGPEAELRLVNSFGGGDHRLLVTTAGADTELRIEGTPARLNRWGRAAEVTVSLPADQARRLHVITRQQAGVLLAQADVDELTANTRHGPIMLSGDARRIEAHSQRGGVKTREDIAVTESFRASTGEGDVVVDFREAAPRTVDATTRQGAVVLALPGSGPYLVHAQAGGSTRVRVPETNSPADAAAEVTARADEGDVFIDQLR